MAYKMLVDLERCVGCWTCSMACKMGNKLEDDDYRVIVRTHGSGAGIDRPQGVYPDLKMNWQPIYQKDCTFCASRVAEGQEPYCAYNCPTNALAFGDDEDPESPFSTALSRCKDRKYHIFSLPDYEGSRQSITYATKA